MNISSIKSVSHISAYVTALKSMELNQKKRAKHKLQHVSWSRILIQWVTVASMWQFDPNGYFMDIHMHTREKFGISIIINFVLKYVTQQVRCTYFPRCINKEHKNQRKCFYLITLYEDHGKLLSGILLFYIPWATHFV